MIRIALRIASLLCIAAVASASNEPTTPTVPFSGTVVSADTGQPLAGAEVAVGSSSWKTDASGHFSAGLPPAGPSQIQITASGFYDERLAFTPAEIRDTGPLRIELMERRPDRRLLVFGGDVMSGRRYESPPKNERRLINDATRQADTRALLAVMAPELRAADLASVNLEITLSARKLDAFAPKSIVFYAHPALAEAVKWAGVDYAAQGNNHVYDYLEPGLADTLAAVDAVGLGHSGAGPDVPSAIAPWRTTIAGKDFSFLSFVGWKGTVTPNQVADAGKGGAAFGDDATITRSVAAEAKAGRAVVFQYHGSAEYSREPTDISERRMHAAIDAGAALVIAHHPHVLQGFELYRGRLIAHSLGNFLFDQTFPETHATMLLKVWMDGDRFARAEVVPVDERDYRPVPAVAGMRAAVLRRLRALSGGQGLRITEMAGHGVITPASVPGSAAAPRIVQLTAPAGETAIPIPTNLARDGWPLRATDSAGAELEFGRSLLWRGDFESQEGFGASDRTWNVSGGATALESDARHGDFALGVKPAGAGEVTIEQKVALRDFEWAPMTLTGAIRGAGNVIAVEYQYRTKGVKGDVPWLRAGTIAARQADWTPFSFDVPKAAVAPDGFRIRYVVQGANGAPHAFALDDLAIVNWEPATLAERAPPGFRAYLRLPADSASRQITLTLADWAQRPATP